MKRCVMFIVSVLIGGFLPSSAQDFWEKTSGPYGGNMTALAMGSNGDLYAGSKEGSVFRSVDSGNSWTEIYSNISSGVITSIVVGSDGSIFVGSRDRWYANFLGYYRGGLFRSTDGGQTWGKVQIDPLREVYSLFINVNGDIFAGYYGVYRSEDNGVAWIRGEMGGHYYYTSSITVDSNGVMFSATGNGVYRSQDNGVTWEERNAGLPDYVLAKAISVAANGDMFLGTWGDGIFVSRDGGESWAKSDSGLTDSYVLSLAIDKSGAVFAGTKYHGIFRSEDGGRSWSGVNNGLHEFVDYYEGKIRAEVRAILVDNRNTLLAATEAGDSGSRYHVGSGGLYRSVDLGEHWVKTMHGITNAYVTDMAVDSHGFLYATTWGNGVFLSHDGGETWTEVNSGLSDYHLHCLDIDFTGDVFVGTQTAGVFRSEDSGLTWVPANYGIESLSVLSLDAYSDQDILIGTRQRDGGVFQSHDNGESWAQIGEFPYVSDLLFTRMGQILASSHAALFLSEEGGESWVKVFDATDLYGSFPFVTSLGMNSDGRIYCGIGVTHLAGIGTSGIVIASDNDGQNWYETHLGGYVQCIAFNSKGYIFVGRNTSGVIVSEDDGQSAQAMNTGLEVPNVTALALDSEDYLYAGTWGGSVFRSVEPTVSTVERTIGLPLEYSLEAPYPNPFNPTTTIQYDLPQAGHVSLTIYDLLGREVEVAIDRWQEVGRHSFVWDATYVPTGIYFVRMVSGEFRQTRKVMVLR